MEFLFSFSINRYNLLAVFWNIFLALVPVILTYYLSVSVRLKKWKQLSRLDHFVFILIFLFWLFMFPNTAYLFTMVRHLANYCYHFNKFRVCEEGTSWMVMFFFIYALAGVPTFYYSLSAMQRIFRKLFTPAVGLFLPVFLIPLTALGVMFGLFERFNSWEILSRPIGILQAAVHYFIDANLFFNFLFFTVSLYLIYYGVDFFIWRIIRKK